MNAHPATVRISGRDIRFELICHSSHPAPDDLLHSLCHWIADAPAGLDPADPPACRIANGLSRVLRDNPALAQWLAESFASQPQQGDFNGSKVKASA